MAWVDPFRPNQDNTMKTQPDWIRRFPRKESSTSYIAATALGLDANPPRWPLRPRDVDGLFVYMSAADTVSLLTSALYDQYHGITMNPKLIGQRCELVKKDAEVMLQVGEEAVQFGDFVMPDPFPAFAATDSQHDVVPQTQLKQWTFFAHTAQTAAVNLIAGYPVGTTQFLVDTIAVAAFGLRPGQTISITKAADGLVYYYLISAINYNVGAMLGADALITLAWPIINTALTNNDVVTTAHLADAPIFFEHDSEFYENLQRIGKCVQLDQVAVDADLLPVVAYVQAGIAATTVAVVPSGAGGVHTHPGGARGGVGLQLGDALLTGDAIHLNAWFYDKIIRVKTVGQARDSGIARTSATVAARVTVEVKC